MSDPAAVQFDIPKMRSHLSKCLKAGKMEPFPSLMLSCLSIFSIKVIILFMLHIARKCLVIHSVGIGSILARFFLNYVLFTRVQYQLGTLFLVCNDVVKNLNK